MTTIVPTSEEDPVLSVVRFTAVMSYADLRPELNWADVSPEVAEPEVTRLWLEAQECVVAGRWLDLTSLMLASADVIFSKVSEKELECVYTVICNLVTKADNLDQVHEMAELISTKVTQQANDKPAVRLRILFNLYNLLDNPYSRFFVYMKALKLAIEAKVPEHVIPSFKSVDSMLREWDLGVKDQRDLFLSISNILKESKGSAKESFRYLTKYLATFSAEDEAKEEACRAVIEFIKAPDMFHCDLLDMPAISQLEKDAKYSLVYQLLKIFLTQRLKAYLDFQAANSTLLKSYGLVHEDCIEKMRLISLVDLGCHDSVQIPYSVIKEELRIEDNEVESWVVKGITSKLLDCKIDQMNQVVIVSRCTERVFGPQQWKSLRTKLSTWRGNIARVITTIQANRLPEDAAESMSVR